MDERTASRVTEPTRRTDLSDTTVGDHDIQVGVVTKFATALAIVMVVLLGAMWLVSSRLKTSLEKRDPVERAILAGRQIEAPPGPRLQSDPNRDMATLRAEENAALEGYAWLASDKSVARIPVARAMEIALANGLPKGMGGTPATPEQRAAETAEPKR
jgi:hypothetical protein